MLDLQLIKARLAAATPGPWKVEPAESAEGSFIATMGPIFIMPPTQHLARYADDADLIAHAPTDIAALVAEVERLRAAIKAHERAGRKISNNPHDRELWELVDG